MSSFTKDEAMKNHDHVAWLSHPEWWHVPAMCPVKRKKGNTFPEIGTVFAEDGPAVYSGINIFLGGKGERKEYESFEAMIADGWEVD